MEMGDFVWVIASSEVLTYHVHIVSFLLLLLLLITHHVSIFFFHQVLRTDSWNRRVRKTGIGRGDRCLAGRNGEPKFDATGEAGEATDFETPLAAHVCSRRSPFAARFFRTRRTQNSPCCCCCFSFWVGFWRIILTRMRIISSTIRACVVMGSDYA